MFCGVISIVRHVGGRGNPAPTWVGLVLILLLALSPLLPDSIHVLRSFLFLFTLLFNAYVIGTYTFPHLHPGYAVLPGFILVLALQSILQTAYYYIDIPLGASTDLLAYVMSTLLIHIGSVCIRTTRSNEQNSNLYENKKLQKVVFGCLLGVTSLFLSIHILRHAIQAATVASIRTPWPLLPSSTLLIIAAMWLIFAVSIIWIQNRWLTTFQAIINFFTTLSLTPLIYKIGFGFDGFLHVASEKILLATGTLHPKPFYYIGQYVFTTWLSRTTEFSLPLIDRWLVPVAASLLIPICVVFTSRGHKLGLYSFLVLGLLPLAPFVATTPQSLAYVLGLSALFLTYGCIEDELHSLAPLLLLSWAIAIHPLAGIPLFFVAIAVLSSNISTPQSRRLLLSVNVLMASVSIPLLFFIISSQSGTPIAWNINSLFLPDSWISILSSLNPFIGYTSSLWPAWSSLTLQALPIVLCVLGIMGFVYTSGKSRSMQLAWLGSAAGLWIAATLLKATGDFTFLIDYERGNYADRLFLLSLFCLLPATLPFFRLLAEHAARISRLMIIGLMLFFIALATAAVYNSLPRHDALVVGHGWSTSAADIEAVKRIERDADGRDYIVLANQSVSAAAVATLGFKRYVDDIFFYPIPTGGSLYELFLRITYQEPSRDTIAEAARLGKTDLVYVVLNDYWWKADTLSEELLQIADRNWTIEDGNVNVYKFELK